MPITYAVDVPASLITTRCTGPVTVTEVEHHFRVLSRDWPPVERLDVLLDLTECTSLPEIADLRYVATRINALGGRKRFGRCAIVASRELLYGLMRVFEFFADGGFAAVRVFRDQSEAMTWLMVQATAG